MVKMRIGFFHQFFQFDVGGVRQAPTRLVSLRYGSDCQVVVVVWFSGQWCYQFPESINAKCDLERASSAKMAVKVDLCAAAKVAKRGVSGSKCLFDGVAIVAVERVVPNCGCPFQSITVGN
jgi:hypothetical protein